MARLILLGVASALPRAGSDPTSLAFESARGDLLLVDCGANAVARLIEARLDPARVRAVFLTHTHPDHLGGLPLLVQGLAMTRRRAPLELIGHGESLRGARALLEAVASLPAAAEGEFDLRWREIPAAAPAGFDAAGFAARSVPVRHSRPTLGLALRDGGALAACSADTGPCDAIAAAAAGAALLVHEMGGAAEEPHAFHTAPGDLGELAARAGVARLVVVHAAISGWPERAAALAEIRRAGFRRPVEFGEPFAAYRF